MEYNLDYRRCGLVVLRLQKNIPSICAGDIILVVQLVTSEEKMNEPEIVPERSSDYFIDYIIEF